MVLVRPPTALLPLLSLVFGSMLGSMLTGCGLSTAGTSAFAPRQGAANTAGIHLDPGLNSEEASKLNDDLAKLGTLPIDGSRIKYFEQIFGGPTSQDVIHYLDQRVHWIVSSETNLDAIIQPIAPINQGGRRQGGRWEAASAEDDTPQVVASNIGTAIWFTTLAENLPPAGIQLGSDLVPINSSRAGVIQLGKAYVKSDDLSLLRLSTLVHEARHSDCTGGVSEQDLALFRAHQEPVHKECGHMHSICPPGHAYAGYPACDDHPWGAYAIESVYLAALARACTDCSAEDKQVALVVFVDSASRVLQLDDLLSGKLGAPDMSSTDAVRP